MLLFSPATFEDGAFSTISKAKIPKWWPTAPPLAAGHPFHTISGLRSAHKNSRILGMWAGEAFDLSSAIPGPKEQAAWDFVCTLCFKQRRPLKKKVAEWIKCVHPDTTVILVNWILLDCTLCNRGDDFLVSPQVALTQIWNVFKADSQKLSRRKHFWRPKNTRRESKRYDVDIWLIYHDVYMYVYKSYRFLYCSVYISIMNIICINYSIVFQPGQPWEKRTMIG